MRSWSPVTAPAGSDGADLHIHTTRSDGRLSPEETILLARRTGLGHLALSDHDRTNPDFRAQSVQYGVEVISSVEITAQANLPGRVEPVEIHLLAPFVDPAAPALSTLLERNRQNDYTAYIKAILAALADCNISISYEELLHFAPPGQGRLSRKELARLMAARGIVSTAEEAFSEYLGGSHPGDKKRANVPRSAFLRFADLEETAWAVRAAHGLLILAHPLDYDLSGEELSLLLNRLTSAAGDAAGLEADYGPYPEAAKAQLRTLARERGLLVSCGSDFHGDPEDRFLPGDPALLEQLRRRASALYGRGGEVPS